MPTEHSMRLHGPWSLAVGEAAIELAGSPSLEACSRPIGQAASGRVTLPAEGQPESIAVGQPWLLSRVFRAPTGVTSEQRVLLRIRGAPAGLTLRVDAREVSEPLVAAVTNEELELVLPPLLPGTHRISLWPQPSSPAAPTSATDPAAAWPFEQLQLIIQGD